MDLKTKTAAAWHTLQLLSYFEATFAEEFFQP